MAWLFGWAPDCGPLRRSVPEMCPDLRLVGHEKGPSPAVQVRGLWWSCRESNPGPPPLLQGFSVCSSRCLCLDLPVLRTSRDDDPSRCWMSRPTPRPSRTVSLLADARGRAEGEPGLTDTLYCLGSESVVALMRIGAYRVAATLTVVSCLHRHASPESTHVVETVQPRTSIQLPGL